MSDHHESRLQDELLLESLLKNNIKERREFVSAAEKIGLNRGEKKCIIVLQQTHLPEETLRAAISELDLADDTGHQHLSIMMGHNFITLVYHERADALIEPLANICNSLEIDYQLGIGSAFNQIEYLAISYREALEAISRHKSGQKINFYGMESQEDNDEIRRQAEVNRLVIQALEAGRQDQVPQIIEKFFTELGHFDPDNAFNLCINSIKDILVYFGIDEIDRFKVKYRFDILGSPESVVYNMIKATYRDNIVRIIDMIKNTPADPAEYLVKETQDIVLRDYARPDLSLGGICQTLNISYGYLSKIFNQRTGSSFVSYLTAVRMTNARRLLLDGALRINEVANAVGYSSSGYFITTFKKYFGISPGDYKARIAGGS